VRSFPQSRPAAAVRARGDEDGAPADAGPPHAAPGRPWGARWWAFAAAWWTLDGLLTATNYHRMGTGDGSGARDWSALLPSLAGAWLWIPLSLGALWLAGRAPIERATWRRRLPVHLAAAAAICLLRAGAVVVLNPWVRWYDALPSVGDLLVASVANNLLLFGMLVGVGHALHFAARYRERDAQLARAELGALRMQLHPHFLFNTLNAAAAYVRTDPAAAERTVHRLAELLRHALDAARVEEIPLADELRLLGAYVEIAQVRFADRLRVVWQVAPEARGALVPNLLLQPLVENAIQHGIAPRAGPGTVTVAARREGDTLHLSVTDDGVGFGRAPAAPVAPAGPARPGLGLRITRQRLRHLYGPAGASSGAERLTCDEPAGGGTRVSVRLPWRTAPRGAGPGARPSFR
jgi:signal transduction histidine kinase